MACTPEEGDGTNLLTTNITIGDGDGDTDTGPGDGDGDGTGPGDGDGDPTGPGDGDGDGTGPGDGDGDPTGPGDGDGDGDPTAPDDGCTTPDPGWGAFAQVGGAAPHFGGTNQFGEEVNICAYEGVPIVIDTSAVWCGPCQLMSMCLGGDDGACLEVFGGNQQAVDVLIHPMLAEIANGTFAWVTVLTENANQGPPSFNDAQAWDANFPADNIWVIADEQQQYYGHLPIEAFPSVWLIDPQMNWQDLDQMTVFTTIISYL